MRPWGTSEKTIKEITIGKVISVGELCQNWLEIPGYRGYHLNAIPEVRSPKGKILTQQDAGNGMKRVYIGKTYILVHNLVARVFYGRPLHGGYRVQWANGDKVDNRPENLMFSGSDPGRLTCLCGHGPEIITHGKTGDCRSCVRCDRLDGEHLNATHLFAPCPCNSWIEFWQWRQREELNMQNDTRVG